MGASALGEVDVADADHESKCVGKHQDQDVEMEPPPSQERRDLDREQNLEAVGFVVHNERSASRSKDKESGGPAVVSGKADAHQNHRRKVQKGLLLAHPEKAKIQDKKDSRRQQSDGPHQR